MTSSKTVLFDGDVLLYMAGFAVERRFYRVTDLSSGLQEEHKYKKEAMGQVDKILKSGRHCEAKMSFDIESKPLKNAEGALNAIIRRTLIDCNATNYKLIVSDPNTQDIFRYRICDTYKANRTGNLKPKHWRSLHEKMVQQHYGEVIVSKGIEADDELGILMTEDSNTICASVDKDLLMIPGTHYDIKSGSMLQASDPGEIYIITRASGKKDLKGHGLKWFYAQMLLGDAVDNIEGIPRIGPVKAYNLLTKKGINEEEVVREIYEKHKDVITTTYELNQQLLWIRRTRDEGA